MKKLKLLQILALGLGLMLFTGNVWGQIIISQYYEGASNNKWIEITNVGTSSVDLTSPQMYLCLFANAAADNPDGVSPTNNQALSGTMAAGQVLLFRNSGAVLPSYASGNSSSICNFNGDDLVIISSSNNTTAWTNRTDVVGNGTSWGTDISFYRNSDITSTNTTYTTAEWTEVSISAVNSATSGNSEYLGTHIYTSGGNTPPSIENIIQTPASGITSSTTVSVSADVTDSDGAVAGVELHWGTSSGILNTTINMTLSSGSTYTTVSNIPAQLDGTTVYYEIYAIDDDADETTSAEQSYTVNDPVTEPSNHPTDFTAGSSSSSAIMVIWTDADPAADGYLIKGSATSYEAIDEPEDGTPEDNALLVQNIAADVEIHEFTGLAASTTYYFKIFPYNGSGTTINYKIDGTVEQDEATTEAPTVFKWDRGASSDLWADANNWNTNTVPAADDIVLLDNSLLEGSYDVILPSGNVKTTIKRLTISPETGSTITLTLPVENTYGATNDAGFVVGDNTGSTDDIIINNGGVLVNASGASSGNGIQVNALANGTLRINDGGKYVHNTSRSTGGTALASILSTVAGTEYGIYEYDVPGTGNFAIAATGRTYGSLVLSRTAGAASYSSAGSSSLTIKGDFLINTGVTYTTTMSGAMNVEGNFTNDGAELNISSSQAVNFNGTGIQFVSGVNAINLQGAVTIANSSVVHIGNTARVTVTGALTNNATATGLVIKSDDTGTGSLIHSTADVPATVERYITGANEAWHLIASPVEAQPIADVWTPVGTYTDVTGYDFYAWHEPSNYWINFKNTTTSPTFLEVNGSINFVPGRGYLVAYQLPNTPSKVFAGDLNTGDQTIALTTTGSLKHKFSNLVGNPYASSIDWKANAGFTRTMLYDADPDEVNVGYNAYIWNQTANNYGVYISNSTGDAGTNGMSRYIPPMQGFFVVAASAGNFVMNNNAKVHSTQAWLKADEISAFRIKAVAPAGYGSDEVLLDFGHQNSNGGADKWSSLVTTAPSLYVPKGDVNYSISFHQPVSENSIIPLNFKAGIGGNYTIQTTFDSSAYSVVNLEDKKTGVMYNLLLNPEYAFTATKEDSPDRFLLHFAGSFGVDEQPVSAESISIYTYGSDVYIRTITTSDALISVFNITGQMVHSQPLMLDGLKQITLNLPTGWYVVQAVTSESAVSRKVFIQ